MKVYWIVILAVLALLVTSPGGLEAYERPQSLTLAHEDQNAYPWVIPGTGGFTGLDIELVKLLSERLKIPIKAEAYPWPRALYLMRINKIDGVIGSSYKPEREADGVYPRTPKGEIDSERRLHTSGYKLYVLKTSPLIFDGQGFKNLAKPIGAQKSFNIIPFLQKMGAMVDDNNTDPEQIFRLLVLGRLDAATIQGGRGDYLLAQNQEWRAKIITYPTKQEPFIQKPYFIMLSHDMANKYPDFAQEFWGMVAKVRTSREFARIVEEFNKR